MLSVVKKINSIKEKNLTVRHGDDDVVVNVLQNLHQILQMLDGVASAQKIL